MNEKTTTPLTDDEEVKFLAENSDISPLQARQLIECFGRDRQNCWKKRRNSKRKDKTWLRSHGTTTKSAGGAEDRNGRPAVVDTGNDVGILRIDFAEKDENLEEINWDDFFAIFDDRNLAFLYEDAGDSRFNKFVDADKNA